MGATDSIATETTPERHFTITRHSIVATIKRAFPGWIIHGRHKVGIQGFCWKEVFAAIDDVEKYRRDGFGSFRFKLTHVNGGEAYPDYYYWEIGAGFAWKPLDALEVHVNQGWREAYVLAVLDDEALIEYEMPRGSTALWLVSRYHAQAHCRRVLS